MSFPPVRPETDITVDLRYLDLSGYAFTGKHAVIDLLREFRGFSVAHFQFEFNLLRIQGGIRDLETALVLDWSPVRSDAAIRRFRRLITRFGSSNSLRSPRSWFAATGWNYDDFFPGFVARSHAYLAELIEAEWRADWPYPLGDMGSSELFLRKLAKRLRLPKAMDVDVVLAAPTPERFQDATRRYLSDLMRAFVNGPKAQTSAASGGAIHTVVMHNTCEPFNPSRALGYFRDGRSIIVDRDPRDNYVAGLWYRPSRVPADVFVKRYRLYRELSQRHPESSSQVMRLRFEDLVLDPATTVARIRDFIGADAADHVAQGQYFKPAESAKNVGIWRTYAKQDEVALIQRELSAYCVDHG